MPKVPATPGVNVVAVAVITMYMAAAAAAVFLTGLGGFRNGAGAASALLAVGGALVAWLALRGIRNRGMWIVFVVILGVIVGAQLAAVAPYSGPRLEALLDVEGLPPPTSTSSLGSSTCRPTCPVVTRTYAFDGQSVEIAGLTTLAVLQRAGFKPDQLLAGGDTLVARTDRVVARITGEQVGRKTTITVRLDSRRG